MPPAAGFNFNNCRPWSGGPCSTHCGPVRVAQKSRILTKRLLAENRGLLRDENDAPLAQKTREARPRGFRRHTTYLGEHLVTHAAKAALLADLR